ncbi:isoprenylcysteine carboxylmethyltransferase family protein [bacterium]|nr:isoprenylcysteine carboxylmethyltransferase family protein [bacterium]
MNNRTEIKSSSNRFYDLHPLLLSSIATGLTVAQIILAFFLHGNPPAGIKLAGWICIWISGIFGTIPIISFRLKGGVPKGKSYMKTTALVKTGIYSIVRHPQGGTAWLLINFGIILIAWHWSSLILGAASMTLAYADTFKADQACIEKFGDDYKRYMRKVPRVNFILGMIRLFLHLERKE